MCKRKFLVFEDVIIPVSNIGYVKPIESGTRIVFKKKITITGAKFVWCWDSELPFKAVVEMVENLQNM